MEMSEVSDEDIEALVDWWQCLDGIPFIQLQRITKGKGETVMVIPTSIEREDYVSEKAQQILSSGHVFMLERNTDGSVEMHIIDTSGVENFDAKLIMSRDKSNIAEEIVENLDPQENPDVISGYVYVPLDFDDIGVYVDELIMGFRPN